MIGFVAELVGEVAGRWLVALAYWLARTVAWLVLYPLLLLLGWARLWLRARGHQGWRALWRHYGPRGLHRMGRQQAGLAGQYLAATLLVALAAGGEGAVLYGLARCVA